jgi:hypothetical protein
MAALCSCAILFFSTHYYWQYIFFAASIWLHFAHVQYCFLAHIIIGSNHFFAPSTCYTLFMCNSVLGNLSDAWQGNLWNAWQCMTRIYRAGQNPIYAAYTAVYLLIPLPKIPCIHTVLASLLKTLFFCLSVC